jgi:CRISPR type III-associated protein (TIGR04423 family)
MKRINIEDIPKDMLFEGYYWYSDESKPHIINGQPIPIEKLTPLPFVVEANFYNEDEQTSISIKNIDGQYLITRADLKGLANLEEQSYIAHRLKDISKIKLTCHWQESEPDALLAGMTTLIPVWLAFTGFEKQ